MDIEYKMACWNVAMNVAMKQITHITDDQKAWFYSTYWNICDEYEEETGDWAE